MLAILRGDAGGAEGELRAFFEAHPASAFGPLKISKSRPAADDKLGRRVAEQLLDEIRGRGWPVGERLGTEAEIQLRLGVSRAALREAVRLLESWSVVEARRGNGGGVVVVAPDPLALRDAARAWLDHAGTSRSAVFAARAPLEVLAVRTLMRTLKPDDDRPAVRGARGGARDRPDLRHRRTGRLAAEPVH